MTNKIVDPFTVQWVFIVAVEDDGLAFMIDHEFVLDVKTKRSCTLDDIYAVAAFGSVDATRKFEFAGPKDEPYTTAFLVFQTPDGHVAASPNIFDNLIPLDIPSDYQIFGAFSVLMGQIIAQKTADITAPLAAKAALSMLASRVADPEADKKTPGGLLRV